MYSVIQNVTNVSHCTDFNQFFPAFMSLDNTKARSNDFAEKNGLKKYDYVLHPRTTGFTFIVQRLRNGNKSSAILFSFLTF